MAALAVAGAVLVTAADSMIDVAAVLLSVLVCAILDAAVECAVATDCPVTVLLCNEVAELLASVLEAAPSGQPPPGLHGSTEQHPVKPFAQL